MQYALFLLIRPILHRQPSYRQNFSRYWRDVAE